MIPWQVIPESDFNFKDNNNAKSITVHERAFVSKHAELDTGVVIGPNAIIGKKVKLSKNVCVGAGAILEGDIFVDEDTHIFPYATIGSMPQDLKFAGEASKIHIGKRNKIREYVNISGGTSGGGAKTILGSDNLLMVYTHIAHDAIVGNECVFANGVQIAGHAIIGDKVVFGGLSAAHQFCRIGDMSMIAAGSMVVQDVAPYCMVQGDRAALSGLNVVGIRRSKFDSATQEDIKRIFKIVFQENLTKDLAMEKIKNEIRQSEMRDKYLEYLSKSERGLCR